MSSPKISIVMPCFNAESTISDSIESVLNQTFTKFELIISDDHSTDKSIEIIKQYNDPRIKLISNKKNKGAAGARNSALDIAQGSYITFLDSDDLWMPNKLKNQLVYMEKNNLLFSYEDYSICDSNRKITGYMKSPNHISYKDLLKKCNIGCLTVMLHYSCISGLRFPYRKKEDYCFWLNILKKNNIIACNYLCNDAIYRKSGKSLSSNKIKEIYNQWVVLRCNDVNFISRIYFMATYILNGIVKHHIYYKKDKYYE